MPHSPALPLVCSTKTFGHGKLDNGSFPPNYIFLKDAHMKSMIITRDFVFSFLNADLKVFNLLSLALIIKQLFSKIEGDSESVYFLMQLRYVFCLTYVSHMLLTEIYIFAML